MKTLSLQLRFLIPLAITLVVAAYLALPVMDQLTLRWFARDLNTRGALVTNALSDSVSTAVAEGRTGRLQSLFERSLLDERLFAIALCSLDGAMLQRTASFPRRLSCSQAAATAEQIDPRLDLTGGPVHVGVHTVNGDAGPVARLDLGGARAAARRGAVPAVRFDARAGARGGRTARAPA